VITRTVLVVKADDRDVRKETVGKSYDKRCREGIMSDKVDEPHIFEKVFIGAE